MYEKLERTFWSTQYMRYLRLREFNNLSIFPQWKVIDLGFLPSSLTSVPLSLTTKMQEERSGLSTYCMHAWG